MRTLKMTVTYDGTDYVGWQRQATGRSIQGLLEDALGRVVGRSCTIAGAGRTDAGVHALGQVASVRIDHPIAVAPLTRALNALLPRDIRVLGVEEEGEAFHARFSARRKVYVYRLFNAPVASPFERRYAWHCRMRLDAAAMTQALALLVGTHDFAAFRGAGTDVETTVRTLHRATVALGSTWTVLGDTSETDASIITCCFEADGFLRHMVRNMVGTVVDVGRGRLPVERMGRVLASGDRQQAGPTAPPEGLFLVRVDYDDKLR